MNIEGQGHSLTLVQITQIHTMFKLLFLRTARPIEARFYAEPPWDEGMKVCSNGRDHMTNMADMSIYGKTLKNRLLWNQKAHDMKLGMHHWVLKYYQVCSNDDHGLTMTYFTARSIWSLVLLYGKKVKQWIFQKLS